MAENGDGKGLPSEDILTSVRTFFFGEGARQEVAVVEAKIENLRRQALRAPVGPMRTFYLNEINKRQAELEVLREEAAEAEYAAQTSQVTRTAVAVGSVLGTLVVAGGVLYVGSLVYSQIQTARIQQEELRRLRLRA